MHINFITETLWSNKIGLRSIKKDCVDCLSFFTAQVRERLAKSGLSTAHHEKNQYSDFRGVTSGIRA